MGATDLLAALGVVNHDYGNDGLSHDPGGKVRIRLERDVSGGACFSDCGQYRHVLWRTWSEGVTRDGFVLWIGMNPSTADATVDDPTVKRERGFTGRWGFGTYVKTNVMDYRATDQKRLHAEGVVPRSDRNLPIIVELARRAELVVLTYGSPHKSLHRYGSEVVDALKAEGIPMHCLSVTKQGFPGHPLYLKSDSTLLPYPPLAA